MTAAWGRPPEIVVYTAGGLSRAAGFSPFDSDRMPKGLRLEDVVTADGFARDRWAVNAFYNLRRSELLKTRPTQAHEVLAVLDAVRPGEVCIVTRNIDDLHERAGSRNVIHTHGELLKARCTICTKVSDRLDDISPDSACPVCGNAGHLRPHVVWVGEEPLRMASVYEALAGCRLFLAIGAPGAGEPTRSFRAAARQARTVEFAAQPPLGPSEFDELIPGPLVPGVTDYVKRLVARS